MSVKHANLLGLMTRVSVGALLVAQLSACSAMGIKTPGEMWSDMNDPRDAQMIEGPRRIPVLNRSVLQSSQPNQPMASTYQPQAMQTPMVQETSAKPEAESTAYDHTPPAQPSIFDRMQGWFAPGDNAAQPTESEEPQSEKEHIDGNSVEMKPAAVMEHVAAMPLANTEALPWQPITSSRKPISGNPTAVYNAAHIETLSDAPAALPTEQSSLMLKAKPQDSQKPEAPQDQASSEEAPAVIKPEMQTEVIENDGLFRQSLMLHDGESQTPLPDDGSSLSMLKPSAGLREEDGQPKEIILAQQSSEPLPNVGGDGAPPLNSVPPTPERLQEIREEAPAIKEELEGEGDVSAAEEAAVNKQAAEEAPDSIKNMPPQEIPEMMKDEQGQPHSENEMEAPSLALVAPAAGEEAASLSASEIVLAAASDAPANSELHADEKAAVQALDSSLAVEPEPVKEAEPASKAAAKLPSVDDASVSTSTAPQVAEDKPVQAKPEVIEKPTKKHASKHKKSKKHAAKKHKKHKKEARLDKPLDYSTVKYLELPDAMKSSAAEKPSSLVAPEKPSVELTMLVSEALAQTQPQVATNMRAESEPMPWQAAEAVPSYVAPQQMEPTPAAPVAAMHSPEPMSRPMDQSEPMVLAQGIVLPPAQFDTPVASISTDTPMPANPPLAPVAANEFLVSRIAHEVVGIFSFVPEYVYMPVLNEHRTVQYLPDSRYMR